MNDMRVYFPFHMFIERSDVELPLPTLPLVKFGMWCVARERSEGTGERGRDMGEQSEELVVMLFRERRSLLRYWRHCWTGARLELECGPWTFGRAAEKSMSEDMGKLNMGMKALNMGVEVFLVQQAEKSVPKHWHSLQFSAFKK